jgi:hypothetical protein
MMLMILEVILEEMGEMKARKSLPEEVLEVQY